MDTNYGHMDYDSGFVFDPTTGYYTATGMGTDASNAYTSGSGPKKTSSKKTSSGLSGFFNQNGFFGKNGPMSKFTKNIGNPKFDYSWTAPTNPTTKTLFQSPITNTGLQGWGLDLGGAYNVGNLAVQGLKAGKGLQDISNARDNMQDLRSDILLGANNSPTIMYDLNANQRDLLRELQRGDYDTVDSDDFDFLGALGGAAKGALTGLPGGLPGVIIGGVGGLANSVIGDFKEGADRRTAELEALYQAVLDSERYHNEQRKQRAYAGLY